MAAPKSESLEEHAVNQHYKRRLTMTRTLTILAAIVAVAALAAPAVAGTSKPPPRGTPDLRSSQRSPSRKLVALV
jgi:hypothetical protein